MTMTKRGFQLAIFSAMAVALISCSNSGAGRTIDINGVQVPARMKLASANVGGSYYPMGNAIAEVLSKKLPGILVTAESSSGSAHNMRMLDGRQIDFGMSNAAITYPAIQGSGEFEKKFEVRAVISLHASINLFIALESSGIRTISDFKGKRISLGPAGGGWDYYTKPILEAHGVSWDEIRPVYETQSNAIDLLTDGTVDAVMVGGSVPHATVLAAQATHDIVLIPFDEAAMDKVNAEYPFIRKYRIPAQTYKGLDQDFWAGDVGRAQLLARADTDPDLVYLIAKTIYENRGMIAEMHRPAAEITPETAAMDIGIPYHEGALRYFEEINIWHPRQAAHEN